MSSEPGDPVYDLYDSMYERLKKNGLSVLTVLGFALIGFGVGTPESLAGWTGLALAVIAFLREVSDTSSDTLKAHNIVMWILGFALLGFCFGHMSIWLGISIILLVFILWKMRED